jgi:RHS repeat-associated protein
MRTVTYRYDALGRRIARVDGGAETRFVSDGWRVVEERDDQDNVLASYVHDGYIDDVVSMRSTVLGGDPRDWFFHSDDQFSVVLLTNDEGEAVERVGYDAWGTPTFQRVANGATASASFFGNPYAFTGRRWDATEQVYHYRLRTFDPAMGRFTTRDPIGIWGDPLNLGNGYTYTGNAPWSWLDPWGLQSVWHDAGYSPWFDPAVGTGVPLGYGGCYLATVETTQLTTVVSAGRDALGLDEPGTSGVGVSASVFAVFGVGLDLGIYRSLSVEGQVEYGVLATTGIGGGFPYAGSAGFFFHRSNAEYVSALKGISQKTTASAGELAVVEVGIVGGLPVSESDARPVDSALTYEGKEFGFGIGAGFPVTIRYFIEATFGWTTDTGMSLAPVACSSRD